MISPLQILLRAWELYRRNAQLFLGFASWLLLTQAAFVLASFLPPDSPLTFLALFAIQIADTLLWIWVGILLMLLTADLIAGKQPDTATLVPKAWTLVWPFAWVGFLQGITTLGGLLLLIVPGLIFVVWFGYAQPALLVEGTRGMNALTASKELVRGRFFTAVWNLFFGPFLVGLIYMAAISTIVLAVNTGARVPLDVLMSDQAPLWVSVLTSVTAIFVTPILYVYSMISYVELKKSKGGEAVGPSGH